MKKFATAIAAIALIGTPAFAADIGVKAPSPTPVPVYNWTGWYVGGNVGYGWGDAPTDIQGSGANVSFPGPLGGFTNPAVAFSDSSTRRLNGFIGGGQLGFNYQVSPHWVLGFETDFQGSGEKGSGNTFVNSFATTICVAASFIPPAPAVCTGTVPANGTAVTSYDAKIAWFGTVRGRVGFLIDDVLVYGTGGLAYGKVKVSGNANVSGAADFSSVGGTVTAFAPGATQFSESKTNVGFALGAGLEGRFSAWLPPNWTWKLEYLYVDLGSLDVVSPFPAAQPLIFTPPLPFGTPFTGTITTHTHFTDNILRVGLNYQFH